ncbi:retrotransposon protein, putative, unclassified, partial [Tanacetum coccineum]
LKKCGKPSKGYNKVNHSISKMSRQTYFGVLVNLPPRGETIESYYTRFYKMMNEMIRNNLRVATMQVNVQTSTTRTPEQNGIVERRNRTLVEADSKRMSRLLNFLYSFGLKLLQPHAILKTDQSSSQHMRKWHITSLMTDNPQF